MHMGAKDAGGMTSLQASAAHDMQWSRAIVLLVLIFLFIKKMPEREMQ